MSLINDMLKDLDARRPDRRRSQAEVLEGLGAPRSSGYRGEWLLRTGASLSFVLLVMLLAVTLWEGRTPSTVGGADEDPTQPAEPIWGRSTEPGALMMVEAIKLLDSAPPPELPDVAQAGPALAPEPGWVRDVTLETHADRTRLGFELSRETVHIIDRDPSRDRLTILLVQTSLEEALPELDLSGTPIQAIHARRIGGDLSVELDLAEQVRTQSTMLADGDSARLVLDFHGGRRGSEVLAGVASAPESPPSFEKKARPPSLQELATQTYQHAVRVAEGGDDETAISALHDALAFDPHHHPAREALASILLRLDRGEEAEALLDDGLMLKSAYAPFAKLKARALAMRGAVPEALELLGPLQTRSAEDPEYHALMAALHQRQGEHAEALTYYRRVLRWQSDKAVWWMGLGISLESESRPQEALAAYRAASVLGGLGEDSRRYIGERIAALQQSPR